MTPDSLSYSQHTCTPVMAPQSPPTLLSQSVSRAIFSVFTPPENEDGHCRDKNTWSYSSTVLKLLWVATHGGGAAGRAVGQRCQATERPTRC